MNNTYSLYRLDSGLFTGHAVQSVPDQLAINVPDDCGCVLGEYDPQAEKVDIETGLVVAYQPPGPALQDVKAARISQLSLDCRAAIEAGFMSSALGSPYRYPAKQIDQSNLIASVTASLLPGLPVDWQTPFWCEDSAGSWNFAMHTAAQIQQVGQDGKAAIVAALLKNQALVDQVNDSATDSIEKVEAITWESA